MSKFPKKMRCVFMLIILIIIPFLGFAQDMKSFTFHTDATSGNGTEVDITGLTIIGVTITGSSTSNRGVTFEVADSIGIYTNIKCSNVDTLEIVGNASLSSGTPQRFQCPVGGFKKFRARISAGSTGTISAVGLGLSKAPKAPLGSFGGSGGGGTGNVSSSGTPSSGQIARWVDGTHIEGFSPLDPSACPSGQVVTDVAANGALICSIIDFTIIAGVVSDAQIPNLNTLSTGLTSGRCVETDGSGHLVSTGSACGGSGGSGLPSDPIACPANQFVTDQSASGTLTCAQPSIANLSDAASVTPTSRTLIVQGTVNQISVTPATAQDLTANRIWTIAIPNNPTLPGTTTGTFSGSLSGNATTATSLAANGTNCGAGQFATGVDAGGNAEGCATPASGDVSSNTSTSVDSEIALFSSTTGKLLKRATGSGIPKLTTGVLSVATAGTDYVVPGGNVATATALAANGANCSPGQFASGVDALGVAEGCADPLTGIPDPSIILTTTNVKEVSGKQIVPRVNALVNTAGSVAYNCDTTDVGTLDGITAGITLALPACTGTNPKSEQEIEYRLQSTLPQTIAYHASFCAMSGFPLPTSTSGDISSVKTYDRLKFRRNAVESCWSLIATTTGVGRGITTLSPSTTYTCDWRIAHTCQMSYTAASTTIIVAAPPAVPADGTLTRYKFLCTSLQTLDWATAGVYVASPNVALPTQCPSDTTKHLIVGVERSSVLGKYQVIATN